MADSSLQPPLAKRRVGIVGSAADKFTTLGEARARTIIKEIVEGAGLPSEVIVISGGCHLGGVDKFVEEFAADTGVEIIIFKPKIRVWEGGYKQRNLAIASQSDEVHCITVKDFPPGFAGMRFPYCYHCKTFDHIKSGGCWTVREAVKRGRSGHIWAIRNTDDPTFTESTLTLANPEEVL